MTGIEEAKALNPHSIIFQKEEIKLPNFLGHYHTGTNKFGLHLLRCPNT
jgi:hypothetical protein